ncbi:uncharacterized protein LOC107264203 [Cephus cinctus]|uniref:Uncharacterized protein LOC107264203 n=1 Tax=Cephus cinctus TaxID=211228 RepID=A0AAJ7BJP0_CEPCN|nr:uncharacterized protein LOC107264203 [Cephus cinctus]
MYKTVRKGDTSLQYTILPQTDQFNASGFPPAGNKPRPKIIKYTMGTLMILIILSCVATPFLMNQNDHNLFAGTILAMGRVDQDVFTNAKGKGQERSTDAEKSRTIGTLKNTPDDFDRRKDNEDTTSTGNFIEKENITEATVKGLTSSSSSLRTTAASLSSTQKILSALSTAMPTDTILSSSTPVDLISSLSSTKVPSNPSRKLPRVTLKLRENETIPQMYMKAGIASYKKGNITTSVLAHGLSLEGLIFKTPEGTIKPWQQKWPFAEGSSYFQWKGINQVSVKVYVVLAYLAVLAIASFVLMFYVHRRASRVHRKNLEEPEVDGQEEDKSTLLGAETKDAEEKE